MKTSFYVYLLRDPRPGKNLQPIYVGKGTGARADWHLSNAETHSNFLLGRVLRKIISTGLELIRSSLKNA